MELGIMCGINHAAKVLSSNYVVTSFGRKSAYAHCHVPSTPILKCIPLPMLCNQSI